MANWIEKWRRNREARLASGQPLTEAERDYYKSAWGKAGRVVGKILEKTTGRREATRIAEKSGERVGEQVAKHTDWRIAERQKTNPPKK
jgi:hypothetical protein